MLILETHPTPFFQIYVILILHSFFLTQAVQEDTHTSPQGSTSLIDLALVSEISLLSSCCVIPPLATSDHNGIQCSLKWKASNPLKASARKVWRYNLADFDTANNLLDSMAHLHYAQLKITYLRSGGYVRYLE